MARSNRNSDATAARQVTVGRCPLPRDVVEALKQCAVGNGRNAEAEHRAILEKALKAGREGFRERARQLRDQTRARIAGESADLIREDRDAR